VNLVKIVPPSRCSYCWWRNPGTSINIQSDDGARATNFIHADGQRIPELCSERFLKLWGKMKLILYWHFTQCMPLSKVSNKCSTRVINTAIASTGTKLRETLYDQLATRVAESEVKCSTLTFHTGSRLPWMKSAVNNYVATSNQWKSWYTARILFS